MNRTILMPQASSDIAADAKNVAGTELAAMTAAFAEAVLEGLSADQRSIPSRFLYDQTGSSLFEEITKLDEYYPTRTEIELLKTYGSEIAEQAAPAQTLVEFGSGSSRKTRLLIEALSALETYVPIDISETFLADAAEQVERDFDGLSVRPVVGDFSTIQTLDGIEMKGPLGFFSGSTIGNLTHDEAIAFLKNAAGLLGEGSAFLIGVDLQKSLDILIPAYDDAKGVTASFSLNLLSRVNRELGGDFDISQFAHRALYNDDAGRIEIYLESLTSQRVHVLGRAFDFAQGERIHTENSHKYTIGGFQDLARRAGWSATEAWTDAAGLFSLHLLRAA